MILEIEKVFEEIDGEFQEISNAQADSDESREFKLKNSCRKIRPTDYRTFLKIKAPQNARKVQFYDK